MDFDFGRDEYSYSGTSRLTAKRPVPNNAATSTAPNEVEMQDLSGRKKTDAEKQLEFKTIPSDPPTAVSDEDQIVELDNFMVPKQKQKKFEQPLLNDNPLDNNVRRVDYINANVPKYGMLFWIEIVQIIWMTTTSIVGLLVLTHAVEINNYVFLIAGALLTLILCSLQVFLYFVQKNKYPSLTNEGYYNDIGTCVVVTFVMEVFTWLSLGIWIRDFAICCDQANCQPNPVDINNFTRFYLSYILLMVLPLVTMIWVYPRSIIAHLNPTMIYNYSKKDI